MTAGLLDWLATPDARRGVRFARDRDGWDLVTYEELAGDVRTVAGQLLDSGLEPGGVVSILVPSGRSFAAAFFGTLLAGGTPSPLVPPTLFARSAEYVDHTAGLLAVASDLVVTDRDLHDLVSRAARKAGRGRLVVLDPNRGAGPIDVQPRAELALLQFTSGSSGRPRGVRVTWASLESNIRMIRDWIGWEPDDDGVHWLPLYHDMGLIGCFLTPIVHQCSFSVMRPDQFLRDPLRWLAGFGRDGMAFTAAPTFGFAYAAKRVTPEEVAGMDFSRWRAAIVGAERLDPGALGRFARLLEPAGFRRETIMPAYGLAEATLAVTMGSPDRVARAVRVDWKRVALGEPVPAESWCGLGDTAVGDGAGWLLGSGTALPGVQAWVAAEDGERLADGRLGEIHVAGPTVAAGYAGEGRASSTELGDGELRTGDAGFMLDGELFVVGRIGDAVKVRGRTLYAEDLEAKLSAIPGVPKGRCVVVAGDVPGRSSLAAIVEAAPGDWVEPALRLLEREGDRDVHVQVLSGGPGTIKRTSSGKPRRRTVWRELVEARLEAELVAERDASARVR